MMPVMRENGTEFGCGRGLSKGKARFVAGTGLRVTHGADHRPRTAIKLRLVTTDTGRVIRIIGHLGVTRLLDPIRGGNLVTGLAFLRSVLFRAM